ncbi:hypothetical protein Moror_4547 [Moniliophthora roreri MCA 2997]|uniref:Uncharacterized protein n=1 Tax=Moniliophthora roreri (strain MCA 2997) TaxID=1381753 RepID=V2XHU8_MONRO|nr:hypothetical protein Moror_4547 [Moniliophthora roreri MCA 2997]
MHQQPVYPNPCTSDPIPTKIRESLNQYQTRTDALAYLRELCMLATKIDVAIKASVYHREILEKLNERICEVVFLLVCTCNDIDCSDPGRRVQCSNYMKHLGADLTRVLKDIETFVLTQNGAARMFRYNLYGQYDHTTIHNFISSVYQALSPFSPPPESDITNSARMLATVSLGKPKARDWFAGNRSQSGQPNISFYVYMASSGSPHSQ